MFSVSFTSIDWLILLIYLLFVVGIGVALRRSVKTSCDFLQAGRSLPAWICGLAFISVSMGAPEVIWMGAWGAKYGFLAFQLFGLGAIPAMLFAGLYMMPLYYGSKARSVPEFLRLRFDEKTRALSAIGFVLMAVFICGISLYAIASMIQALHLFDGLFLNLGLPLNWTFAFSVVLLAAMVLVYVLLGGLAGAMYNQVLQFLVLIAGLLPMVLLGLKKIGGWSGLKASVAAVDPRLLHEWKGLMHAGGNGMGIDVIGLTIGLGLALGCGYWCTNFSVIQTAMAASDADAAQRAPLIAAIARVLLPFLVILPGLLAIGLPTPHSTTVTRVENGTIFRETMVVPKAVEEGQGLVPAESNAATGQPLKGAGGKVMLAYEMATPSMLLHFLPAGLLGLGLTALIASLMSGLAGNLTAFNTVLTYDLYQPCIRKDASDQHYLMVARFATLGAVTLAIGIALALSHVNSMMDLLLRVFSLVSAPLFATILLGMFWKRATGHGAFAGLLAGTAAVVLHHGLTLPVHGHPGVHGGWIAALHHYHGDMAQNLNGAILAFGVNLMVTMAVSLMTKPRPEPELAGLVHSLTSKPSHAHLQWWKRPEALAVAILVVAVGLNILFA